MTATISVPTRFRFAALSLLASFLLFFVQPLIAKIALPQLGGNAAVWTSAMVAFQLLLLVGYGYAHWLLGLAQRWRVSVHAALFVSALLWLPLGLDAANAPPGDRLLYWVPWRIIAAVGPLFALLAAQAPLLQGWLRDSSGAEPYGLYRFSNIGSFLGLLAFPLIVEPLVPVSVQTQVWSGGFVLFAALSLWLMQASRQPQSAPEPMPKTKASWPDGKTAARWITLAAVASGLILSTTTHLTTDIVAMPLLWVLPLALYLLSFVLAFADGSRTAEMIAGFATPLIACLGIVALSTETFEIFVTGPAALALLFVASLALHSRLYRERPGASGLTAFYLLLAIGGAIGGMLVAIVAPLIFDWTYEFPLLILAAISLAPGTSTKGNRAIALASTALAIIVAIVIGLDWLALEQVLFAELFCALAVLTWKSRWATLVIALCGMLSISGFDALRLSSEGLRQRSYFGIYTIRDDGAANLRRIVHGTTNHGIQSLDPARQREPISYFGHQSGVGLVLDRVPQLYGPSARIGVLGIGAGTLACYARAGQKWTFYEIDPLVVDIAVRQRWFTYMVNCTPDARVRIGDARLTLASQAARSLDVLVMDAFTSDTPPTHLITRQAFDIYDRVLAQNGVMLVHISNRYLDLEPVLASEAQERGWTSALRRFVPDATDRARGETASVWIAVARTADDLHRSIGEASSETENWRPLNAYPAFRRWSDDFGSVTKLIKWRGE